MYQSVFVAGTFDGIHRGHQALLRKAFLQGKHVTIGLTSDEFVKKLKKTNVSDFDTRKKALERLYPDAHIIPIQDVHEPAASMPSLDAIVVSTKTAFRAREINDLRQGRGLSELAILEVPMTIAEDKKPISSTRMRSGEIDQDGRLTMPDNLRPELARPLGRVLADEDIAPSLNAHRSDTMITVGDVATEILVGHAVTPALAIIDQKVGRKPYDTLARLPKTLLNSLINVRSGPGYIAKVAVDCIETWARQPRLTLLVVDGEEDLLTLPAIVHAPKGSVVYYGQPEQALWACGPMAKAGLVEVVVSQDKKREVQQILDQFLL